MSGARLISLLVVVAMLLLLYLPFADNGFLYDDYAVVLEPAPLAGAGDVARLVSRPFYPELTYYRPLALLSYQLQRAVVGDRPASFHRVNAVLVAVIFLLAYGLLRRPGLRIEPVPALLAAALLAAHPVASSCVMPIAGRDTLLATIFVLASLQALMRSGSRASWIGTLLFVLALGSKESAVVVPALVLLVDCCGLSDDPPGREPGRWIRRYLPLVVVLIGYLLLRRVLFHGFEYPPGSIAAFLLTFAFGLQATVVPFVALIYEPPVASWLSPWRLVLALTVAVSLIFAVSRLRDRRMLSLFWIGWFVICLLPTSNLVGQETRFAERYLMLGLLAWPALAATWVSARWSRLRVRQATTVLGAILLVAAAAIVWHRGPSWKEEAFYRAWIRHDPQRVTARYNFGTVLEKLGKPDEALAAYEVALELDPTHDGAHNNLGKLQIARGAAAAARRLFERAVALNPRNHQAHNNLGSALALEGDLDGAMAQFRRSIEIEPGYKNARANLGHALVMQGQPVPAMEQFRAALKSDPDYADAHYGLGSALLALGRADQARVELQRALQLDPDLVAAGQLLEQVGIDRRP